MSMLSGDEYMYTLALYSSNKLLRLPNMYVYIHVSANYLGAGGGALGKRERLEATPRATKATKASAREMAPLSQ